MNLRVSEGHSRDWGESIEKGGRGGRPSERGTYVTMGVGGGAVTRQGGGIRLFSDPC